MSEKTERATPKRLQKARREGDSPVSAALSQSVAFLAGLSVIGGAVPLVAASFSALFSSALRRPFEPGSAGEVAAVVARSVLVAVLPVLATVAGASAAASLAQTGGVLSARKLAPTLERLNPVTGVRNLLSWPRLIGIARALCAACLVGFFALRHLQEHAADFANSVGDFRTASRLAASSAVRVAWLSAFVGLTLGLVDLGLTRRAWFRRLRMSKDEVKREYRESEGDPALKAARRRAHQEALTGASLGALKTASVVIVNPTHLATALEYRDDEDLAPKVVAQGQGEMAKLIVEAARAYGVPIVRDVPIARALNELEIGDEIPEALYEAVAEILRELWQTKEGREVAAPAQTPTHS